MKFKKTIFIIILLLIGFVAFADEEISDSSETVAQESSAQTEVSLQDESALLLADEPIIYGEESFIQRIEEKTGGNREPVGVVLSGGSARAFAHIGVLQYLEEQGIVPDFIISNSMGSIIALLYSAGLSPDQIIEIMNSTDIGQLFDFTLPVNTGLLSAEKFLSYISIYLGKDLRLEDLSIPVIVVCEDMVTKRQILFAEGDFYQILEASFALPVYFGSVGYDGHVLIDGGIANLVPLDIAYRYTNNVLVSTTFYAGKGLNLKNPITGLNVSIDIGKRRQGVQELLNHTDAVWVRCNVEDFSFMDFASGTLLAQQGYISCQEQSEAITNLAGLYNTNEETTATNNSFKQSLDVKRTEIGKQMPKAKKNYDIFNRTSDIGTSSSFGVALYSHSNNGYFLRDDLLVGLKYAFSYDDLNINVTTGISTKYQSFGYDNYSEGLKRYNHVLPALDLILDYYLGNHFKFNFDGTVYFTMGIQDSIKINHTELLSQSIQYRTGAFSIGLLSGDFEFIGRQTFELTFQNSGINGSYWDASTPFTTLMAEFYYNASYMDLGLKAGLQSLGWAGTSKARLFGATSLDVALSPWSLPLEVSGTFACRFAFDNKGEIPVFSTDGYMVFAPNLKAQGCASSETSPNEQQYVIATGLSVDWTFYSNKVSLAELILLSDNTLGVFANLLWYKGAIPTAQLGAKISTEIGFLGLKSAPLIVYVFYDFSVSRLLWKVELKTSF